MLAFIAGTIALLCLAASAQAMTRAALAAGNEGVIDVRFREAAEVRGPEGSIGAATPAVENGVEALLERIGPNRFEPLVEGISQTKADRLAETATSRSDEPGPSMASWYRITLEDQGSVPSALAILRSSPIVAYAGPAPVPVRPPSTPDFSSLQTYLDPAPVGTDAEFALADPRTRGSGVRIVDLEYYWTGEHEDLGLPPETDLGAGTFTQWFAFDDEHGTAVFGVMVGKDNGFGVTGGVPDADMRGISPLSDLGYNPAGALTFLMDKVSPGDVILIEQQTQGPNGGAYVPLEWNQASFDAIKALGDLGAVVVETGANGSQDLDSPSMLGRFDRSVRDSGAILVGAGNSVTRAPHGYTSRGTRVDLQGHGDGVVTTGGYGNLQGSGSSGRLIRYTSIFNGTSSAGPIVVNAVVAVQSYLKATGRDPWTAGQVRDLLRNTGTPQSAPESGLIGPLPDTAAALKEIETDPPVVQIEIADGSATLTASDGWGKGIGSIEYRLDGGSWLTYGSPFTFVGVGKIEYRATDVNGNVSAVGSETVSPVDPPVDPPIDPPVDPPVVDTTPPQTTIKSKVKKTYRVKRGGKAKIRLRFVSSEKGSRFVCRVDAKKAAPCRSPKTLRLGRGNHRITVRAVDAAGNADPTPARVTVRVQVRR